LHVPDPRPRSPSGFGGQDSGAGRLRQVGAMKKAAGVGVWLTAAAVGWRLGASELCALRQGFLGGPPPRPAEPVPRHYSPRERRCVMPLAARGGCSSSLARGERLPRGAPLDGGPQERAEAGKDLVTQGGWAAGARRGAGAAGEGGPRDRRQRQSRAAHTARRRLRGHPRQRGPAQGGRPAGQKKKVGRRGTKGTEARGAQSGPSHRGAKPRGRGCCHLGRQYRPTACYNAAVYAASF
jgi:hypothetical protein